MVGAGDKNIELYLRNKHPYALYDVKPENTVLFVHGASYPAHASFDLAIEGQSWMDWMAKRGYDVYSLDLRGYGKSSRPPEMAEPPEANPPLVDTTLAVADLSRVVEFILSRRNAQKLVLVGWSWGATVVGSYAVESSGKVERLVLYAPQWLRETQAPAGLDPARLGAWRTVRPREARDVWLKAVPEAKRDAVMPKAWFETWMAATLASDPEAARPGAAEAGQVRAPNGVIADAVRFWAAGKPRWEPSRISVPTLVVQGEWDAEAPPAMGQAVFNRLSGSPFKRYVMVGEATHAALLEKNRLQLYRAVQEFLEEPLR
jgi:pimeloyl-ACP methyl ester carboxylesterase